jgi:hypothetical protein
MKIYAFFMALLGQRKKTVCNLEEDCPNCWGQQLYNGEVKEVLSREHIDLKNAKRKLGWIEAYVIKHFEGIGVRIKNGRKVSPASKEEW